ncbi:AraC-like DNA-binding protein [Sphingosinicella soli]|uniref:AraC-like DNA-binding protein n=1 Tax=Sphingosinicella soli TaxID=333708 RepID=A0A7W7B2J2_9SPHN|nr:AraC-like DNA-binding protein [Sphingosinicella soli]
MKHSSDYPLEIRPVMGFEDDYPAGFVDPLHSHERAQLSYANSGVMLFVTERSSFVLPPRRAIWVPAGMQHKAICRGPVNIHTLFIDPEIESLPHECRVFEVSPLVRALIQEVFGFEPAYDEEGREGRIVRLLLEEIERMPNIPVMARMPEDRRLLRVCQMILDNPADPRDIDDWAGIASMGRRTFTRLFKQQTGMGLATWRQQVRLMEALSLLASGTSITNVAYDVGYESPSAFTAMFHRSFGRPPSHYVAG